MSLAAEVGISRLSKYREELCGDAISVVKSCLETTIILSDGLGSGVKANILATLTTNIASGLLKRQVAIEHVISTIADTLPLCKRRGLAYSTLAILQVGADGNCRVFEYDSPEIMLFRQDQLVPIDRRIRDICGQRVTEANFRVVENDVILMVSDGILHAGVGGLYDLGLGQEGLLEHFCTPCSTSQSAEELADEVINLAQACYLSKPGDDCSAVVVKIRQPERVAVMTGPALTPEDDNLMVKRLFEGGRNTFRAVCGGTTAQIVSRLTKKSLVTSLEYVDPRVPPIGYMEGIDLATEGVLTLNLCYEILRSAIDGEELPRSQDGATLLAKRLWNAEEVSFLVGRAINPAHANLEQLVHLAPRAHVIDKIARLLRKRGVTTDIVYY